MQTILVETIQARGATVEIYEVCVGLNAADLRKFEIRTSTGYRAVFPDAHTECTRVVCVKHDAFTAPTTESRTHCHGLHHLEQVTALARKVAKTYGGKAPTTPLKKIKYGPRDWAPMLIDMEA